jgi:release factor glutamine methyltransferase
MNIRSIRQLFRTVLSSRYEENESRIITDWVLEDITGFKKSELIVRTDENLDETIIQTLKGALEQLSTGRPVQYVLGYARFDKLNFKVNESVLIPRPETEELVAWASETIKEKNYQSVIEVGTGSGCISIALKKRFPELTITAIDISEDALNTAQENAATHETKIHFQHLDFLDEAIWAKLPTVDLLISNPPYIPVSEKEELSEHVKAFEPAQALFVPDDQPLLFYEALSKFAATQLNPLGAALVETHEKWQDNVVRMFRTFGMETYGKNDLYGRPRMARAIRNR